MRISDWSSDVCSSDLVGKQADARLRGPSVSGRPAIEEEAQAPGGHSWKRLGAEQKRRLLAAEPAQHGGRIGSPQQPEQFLTDPLGRERRTQRSEERRVGTEGGSPGRSRWSPEP